MLIQTPRLIVAVTRDVCQDGLVAVDLIEQSATIAPMVNAYGVPLCLKCADKLGFVVKHATHTALAGYVTEEN